MWSAMTPEEKLPYQQRAAVEREQVATATEAWKKAAAAGHAIVGAIGVDETKPTMANKDVLIFPVARIRKICKLDPEVRGLSKEATLLITKVAELATAKLGLECVQMATIQNRRKLLPEDVAQVCRTREQFMFLREDIVDLQRAQLKESAVTANTKSSSSNPTGNSSGSGKNALAAKNTKPLTDFFKATS
jgi:DNA-directed RNA polymerase I subunit RPA43